MSKFNPGGIKIDGNGQHEDDVKETLNKILENPAGAILLNLIDKEPEYVTIKAYKGGEGCHGADTKAVVPADGAPANVKPYGGYYDGQQVDGEIRTRYDEAKFTGTGRGTDVTVGFSLDSFKKSGCDSGRFGSKPDEALFHELIHCYRAMRGNTNRIPCTGKLHDYLNEEEWLAILVTNIYISAKNHSQNNLRASHQGHTELQAPLNTSIGFMGAIEHRQLVRKYAAQEVDLFYALHQIQSNYNPVREYVLHFSQYASWVK